MGRFSDAFFDFIFSITKGSGYQKGEQFEKMLEIECFPEQHYDLVHRTHNEPTNLDRFVESSRYPDFKFRDKATGKEFWVEAKFRTKWYGKPPDQYIYFIKDWQLERYKEYDKKLPLFMAIGTGHKADSPNQIYLIPVRFIQMADRIYKKFLSPFTISNHFTSEYESDEDIALHSQALWERLDE